jgi:5-(carboxyamino)imidazole ribonucleotide mutase/phosphoribosylaminoimidazole-succinocarboxamide synthase
LLVILMGSKSDLSFAKKIAEAAQPFGFEVVMRIASAHKTAAHALKLLQQYEADARPKVYITIAGRSNALSGFTDGAVLAPVIACPPYSEAFSGADIFSSLRMPSGIAPAVVLEPANAALLAAKIIAVADPEMRKAVKTYQAKMQKDILMDDQEIQTL